MYSFHLHYTVCKIKTKVLPLINFNFIIVRVDGSNQKFPNINSLVKYSATCYWILSLNPSCEIEIYPDVIPLKIPTPPAWYTQLFTLIEVYLQWEWLFFAISCAGHKDRDNVPNVLKIGLIITISSHHPAYVKRGRLIFPDSFVSEKRTGKIWK